LLAPGDAASAEFLEKTRFLLTVEPGTAAGPIAVFDSGVGGLSVLRHMRALLPHENLLYLADQAHVPYGERPPVQVCAFAETITRFFLEQRAKAIVVACNTATAAALSYLRATFPHCPFVGMEPAVKPAAESTETGVVGVLATAGTFESQRYASLMARFAQDVALFEDTCDGLVALVEAGRVQGPEVEALLRRYVTPMMVAGVDTLVLGCTHYPFVLPALRQVVGDAVAIIDPAPAVVHQVQRVLQRYTLAAQRGALGTVRAFTTGEPRHFAHLARQLLGYPLPVTALHWQDGRLQSVA
ncbi:MAG TPA: glutamate racemase, partial [Candidatus Binatia bacterium]|nr:glutamate racemase [Candidatus Binatia bacterium]